VIKGSFRVPVPFDYVFPYGALCLGVARVSEFDAPRGSDTQARDKVTGLPLWAVTVVDLDPEAAALGRQQVKVKVMAKEAPVIPPARVPGYPPSVEFTGLVIIPWTDDSRCTGGHDGCRARQAFAFKAEAMTPGRATTLPDHIPTADPEARKR
jgi:hypothetical protein